MNHKSDKKRELEDKIKRLIPIYGAVGSKIIGSVYMRNYCYCCGEPIRSADGSPHCCEVCSGVKRSRVPAGYSGPQDPDANGSWANAVKAMEGG